METSRVSEVYIIWTLFNELHILSWYVFSWHL